MLHLQGTVDSDGVRCLQSLLDDHTLRSCVYVDCTPSTNSLALDELTRQAVAETALPRLYLTDSQTAGRGRLGRTWTTNDDSLTFSLLIRNTSFNHPTSVPLSLAVGVNTAEAIDAFISPRATQLKWPNDVYIDNKKVAGILVEANQRHPELAVVGIGINIHTAPMITQQTLETPQSEATTEATSETVSVPAAALSDYVPQRLSRFDVLDEVIRRLIEPATSSIVSRFRQKCYLTGERIMLSHSGEPRTGQCHGIDEQGRLVVDISGRPTAIQSGEATKVRRTS